MIFIANHEYCINANQIKGEVKCRCEIKDGGLLKNGLICETNEQTNITGSCESDEWCIGNSSDVYSTRLRPMCQQGKPFQDT